MNGVVNVTNSMDHALASPSIAAHAAVPKRPSLFGTISLPSSKDIAIRRSSLWVS